jgi:hypothetical protein
MRLVAYVGREGAEIQLNSMVGRQSNKIGGHNM